MRSDDDYNAQLQERDLALLKGLFESRLMTLAHVTAIHFGGAAEAAKKRVQKLKASGYLTERPRRAYEPSILHLTRKAFTALAEGGYLDAYPQLVWSNLEKRARVSDLTLRHELAVMDVKAAIYTAATATPEVTVAECCTWPLLYEFHASPSADGLRSMTVRPDGFLRLRQHQANGGASEQTFFLEIDRSTEVLDTLVTRCLCYRDFLRRGGLAVRNGRPREEAHLFPFRVLIVTRTEQRREHLIERLLSLRPPILTQVWLATQDEAVHDALGPIWLTPRDCRQAAAAPPPHPLLRMGDRAENDTCKQRLPNS